MSEPITITISGPRGGGKSALQLIIANYLRMLSLSIDGTNTNFPQDQSYALTILEVHKRAGQKIVFQEKTDG